MKKVYNILWLALMLCSGAVMQAQGTLSGKVTDEQNLPLPGANVQVKGAATATVTDAEGLFTLNVSAANGTITISFIGLESKTVPFNVPQGQSVDLGSIALLSGAEDMETVVIVGRGVIDLVQDRQTPVAVSNITQRDIRQKSGNLEFPEVMKNTPSVYVASQAGGYGDSKMYTRGFDQTNTAFLLNGQPINGMEDGNMYWSNWSGMTDVANSVQVQRGLGSSKLAISSVGGTVNIVTKTTDLKEGGFAQSLIGNDRYTKNTVGYNTGLMENGFGASIMLTKWSGDGYNRGTYGDGINYFLSFGYKANDKHLFNFLLFGAPQWHDQNYTKSIATYLKYGRKYNNNYGFLGGDYLSERRNYYHKPVANFNWDYTINDRMSLSSVLYASWGRGGGTGNWGNKRVRTADGHIDFDAIVANNKALAGGIGDVSTAYALRNSVNNHAWYGLVSNFNHKLNENFSYNAGLDLRTYKGTHYREISHFLGLSGFRVNDNDQYPGGYVVTEQFSANPWSAFWNKPDDNQKVNYDYDERISYGGVFGQAEYTIKSFSAFVQAAVSTQSHVRWDRFQYVEANEKSDKVNNNGYNVKGGASYNVNSQNSVFVNAGYYSRQPYHDNIYLNFGNDVNPLTENEKITGLEAGYRFTSEKIKVNLDLYRTSWKDRVTTDSTIADDDSVLYFNNSGLSQLHTGLELSFSASPWTFLDVNGFGSFGNWEYDDDAYQRVYDENQNLVADGQYTIGGNPVLGEEVTDVDGSKVGGGAQTTFGLGLIGKINSKLSVDVDYRNYAKLYSTAVVKNNLELPSYDLMDAGVTYKLSFPETSIVFRLNVNNVLNEGYFSEMTTANPVATGVDTYKGLNVNNSVFFGNARTWNFSMRYNF